MNDDRVAIESLIIESVAKRGRARTDKQGAEFAAEAILSSDWLAEHDRAVAEKARAEVMSLFDRGLLAIGHTKYGSVLVAAERESVSTQPEETP